MLLVHVAGPTLAVGEALVAEGTLVGLGTQQHARVPQARLTVELTVARIAAGTATCKRHGVRAGGGVAGWRAASRRVKQAAAAAGANTRPGHQQRVREGWRGYTTASSSSSLLLLSLLSCITEPPEGRRATPLPSTLHLPLHPPPSTRPATTTSPPSHYPSLPQPFSTLEKHNNDRVCVCVCVCMCVFIPCFSYIFSLISLFIVACVCLFVFFVVPFS